MRQAGKLGAKPNPSAILVREHDPVRIMIRHPYRSFFSGRFVGVVAAIRLT
jgi:hypothetical protein